MEDTAAVIPISGKGGRPDICRNLPRPDLAERRGI